MPKRKKPRGAERTKSAVAGLEVADSVQQQPGRQLDVRHRPRTRAWIKEQQEKEKALAVESSSAKRAPPLSPQPISQTRTSKNQRSKSQPTPQTAKQTAPASKRGRTSGYRNSSQRQTRTAHDSSTKQKNSHQAQPVEARIQGKAKGDQKITEPQDNLFSEWLSQIEPVAPEGLPLLGTPRASSVGDHFEDNMNSSSASRDDGSTTAKLAGTKSVKTVSLEKLRVRHVRGKRTADSRLEHLRSILNTRLPERSLNDIGDIKDVTENFLSQIAENPHDSCYVYIDEFSYRFDKGKTNIGYPIVNRRYFEADLERCLVGNEAVLQRTIMIHIINQYWIKNILDWNTEGQWSQPKDTRLPSRGDGEISLPKPDLAVSFKLESFTVAEDDSDPIPQDLAKCISPDGGGRCFPFLFFEVKKAGADLQEAYTANLHSASQALFNIYTWMVRAGQEEQFFDEVRVFSVVFNAQDLGVRVHRGVKLSSGVDDVCFEFDVLEPLARYTKDQACLLIQAILNDYASKVLHPILKSVFATIIGEEDQRREAKRKAAPMRNSSTKRTRRYQDEIQHTGHSFGMSNLST